MKRTAGCAAVFLVGVSLAACGGSDSFAPPGAGGGTGAAVSAEKACADYGAALCAKTDECAPLGIELFYGDAAACVERSKIQCVGHFSDLGTSSTPAVLENCTNAVAATTCESLNGAKNSPPAACRPAPGPQADGTACGDDGQCKTAFCKKDAASVCGVCAARIPAGGACSASECAYGSVCVGTTCVTPVAAGGTCDLAHPCGNALVCNAGVCATPLAEGAACGTPDLCNHAQGFACDDSKTCQAAGRAKAGEACGKVAGKFVVCVAGGTCTASPPAAGTCVAPAPDGGACDPAQNLRCLAPALCVNNVCTLPDTTSCK